MAKSRKNRPDKRKREEDRFANQKHQELDRLRRKIIGLREQKRLDLSPEQEFLKTYFHIPRNEITGVNFATVESTNYEKDEELEIQRYNALMKLYLRIENENLEGFNKMQDKFHPQLKTIDEFSKLSKSIEKNTIAVQKMRNLQLINRMAHVYDSMFNKILYSGNAELHDQPNKGILEAYIKNLYSKNQKQVKIAREMLRTYLSYEQINSMEKNLPLRYCAEAKDWFFTEKHKYILEIAKNLHNSNEGYNYGISKDRDGKGIIIFDVPGFGQFSLHFADNEKEEIKELTEKYGVQEFQGVIVGQNICILAPADKKLLKNTKGLSIKDEYLRKLLCQDPNKTPEQQAQEEWCKGCKNPEHALEVRNILKEYGLNLEEFKSQTSLKDTCNLNLLKELLELIKSGELGRNFEILKNCKGLLKIDKNQMANIRAIIAEIDRLGINKSIFENSPNFLLSAVPQNIEVMYKLLKQYGIELSDENLRVAFEMTSQYMQKYLDLAIEMGMYSIVQKDLTTNLGEEQQKEKMQGEELVVSNKYSRFIQQKEVKLNEFQKDLLNRIYDPIASATQNGVVLNIGIYTYSAPKVKNQISSIIKNRNLTNPTEAQTIDIILVALLKNKKATYGESVIVRKIINKQVALQSRKVIEDEIRQLRKSIAILEEKIKLGSSVERKVSIMEQQLAREAEKQIRASEKIDEEGIRRTEKGEKRKGTQKLAEEAIKASELRKKVSEAKRRLREKDRYLRDIR